jgi:uncharacterized membrane protein
MKLTRVLRHLLVPDWVLRRAFPPATLQAIEAAIVASERQHEGELRFVAEGGLHLAALLRGRRARERAVEVFSALGVWDTAHDSGVLIYVQLADHSVEILADRGISARVPQATWNAICRELEAAYRTRDFESGSLRAIDAVTALLREHFPPRGANPNELPDRPVLL